MGCICSKDPKISNPVFASPKPQDMVEELPKMPPVETKEKPVSEMPVVVRAVKKPKKFVLKPRDLQPLEFYDFDTDQKSGEFERSSLSDWQTLLKDSFNFNSWNTYMAVSPSASPGMSTVWDEQLYKVAGDILDLPPRDWFKENLDLLHRVSEQEVFSVYQELISLKEHFRWLVWSVGFELLVLLGGGSPCNMGVPRRLKSWLRGFRFKNVRFKLVYTSSEANLAFKSEKNAAKLFALGQIQSEISSMVLPMLVSLKLGVFSLYAVPLCPPQYITKPKEQQTLCILGEKISVPDSSIFKLEGGDHYLVYNVREVVPHADFLQVLCLIGEEFTVFEDSEDYLTPKQVESMLYPEGPSHKPKIVLSKCSKYSWDIKILQDVNVVGKQKNFIASLLGDEILGDAILSFSYKQEPRKRFSVYHLSDKEINGVLVDGLMACTTLLALTDSFYSSKALGELIHRKGLRIRHEWILASISNVQSVRDLIETDILARAVKHFLNHSMEEQGLSSINDLREILLRTCSNLIYPPEKEPPQHLDIILLLFLSRLKAVADARRYFEATSSKKQLLKFLGHPFFLSVYESAARAPGLFLSALEFNLGISFKHELLNAARIDNFFFRYRQIQPSEIESLDFHISGVLTLKEESHIFLLKFLEETAKHQAEWISDSEIELTSKEDAMELLIPCDLYALSCEKFYRSEVEMPSLQIIEEWANSIEALTHNLITVDGSETVLAEILIQAVSQRYFLQMDCSACEDLLNVVSRIIARAVFLPPEVLIAHCMWKGLLLEQRIPAFAEQHLVSALVLISKLSGDPRGRGNIAVPWQMLAAFKVEYLARDENRLLDAQAASEHFEAVFQNFRGQFPGFEKPVSFELSFDRRDLRKMAAWMNRHSMVMHQSGKKWGNLYSKVSHKNTLIKQLSTSHSMGYTSEDSNSRVSKRAMQQSSLTQVLLPENGAINISELKGTLYVWGSDTNGQLGAKQQQLMTFPRLMSCLKDHVIREVAVGSEHCIAVTVQGQCFAWGYNNASQLGLGPDLPETVSSPTLLKSVTHIKKASCGYQHSLLLNYAGSVFSMGSGEGGVLGHGNTTMIFYPRVIEGLKSCKVTDIQSGAYHNLALTREGQVYVWGRGDGGQLGFSPEELGKLGIEGEIFLSTPSQLSSLSDIIQVACGEAHSLALNDEFEVFAWGWGSNGQLGIGHKHSDFEEIANLSCVQHTPCKIGFGKDRVTEIACGGLFSLFVTSNHEVLACGMNDFSQLGLENPNEDHTDIPLPTKLDCFRGYPVKMVFCGENHTLALSAERMTWAWGRAKEGQLGLGDTNNMHTPRPVQSLSNAPVFKLACGRTHSLALIGDPKTYVQARESEKEPSLSIRMR